jgi:hypothetical protein
MGVPYLPYLPPRMGVPYPLSPWSGDGWRSFRAVPRFIPSFFLARIRREGNIFFGMSETGPKVVFPNVGWQFGWSETDCSKLVTRKGKRHEIHNLPSPEHSPQSEFPTT